MEPRELAIQTLNWFGDHYTDPVSSIQADTAFVYGRYDEDRTLTRVISELLALDKVKRVMVSGNIGVDSGDLEERGYTEASKFREQLIEMGIDPTLILAETKAKNGAQNNSFGLKLLLDTYGQIGTLILVGHPSSLLRLYANHRKTAREEFGLVHECQLVAMPWPEFYPNNLEHQKKVIVELEKMITWPKKLPTLWADPVEIPADIMAGYADWKALQRA